MSHTHHHAFRFYANGEEFFPHAGTRLAFVNRGIDTLNLRSLPPDTLAGGDAITVTYAPTADEDETTVFQGTVEQITASVEGGPSNGWQDAVVSSPWSKMDRLIYQQQWYGYTSQGLVWSSNLVLNQDKNGNSIGFKKQLKEIFDFAADRCGIDYTDLTGGQALPFDEVRDLSCAQAVNRVLRWFPKKIVRFDYSGDTPNLELADPSAASWVSGIDKSSIVRTYNAHPIAGVYLETVTTGDENGVAYRNIGYQKYPANADPTAVDCLHATIQLAGGSSSASYESFKTHCESDVWEESVGWWIRKHPRLAKFQTNQVQLIEHSSDDHADCPRIADASVEELQKFGLKAKVVKFVAHVNTKLPDEEEEDLILQMQFVMSNAEDDKTYTRQIGGSSTSGETIPTGLAQAIYEDRSQALQSLKCLARLGSAFPKVGETYEGLILQSFEVDPYELTAECNFGQPEHLSPDDMAGIMTGFRNRIRSTACWERKDGKRGGGDDEDIPKSISPMSATEFCPGLKAKTTIKSSASGSKAVTIESSKSGGNIELKTSAVESGKTMGVHTVSDADGNELAQIMSTEDIEMPDSGGSTVEADGNSIEFTTGTTGGSDPDSDGGSGSGGGGTSKLQIKGFATASGETESIVHDLVDGNTGVPKNYLFIVKDGDDIKYVPIGMLPDDMPKEITVDDDGKNCTVTPVKGTSFQIPLGKTISSVDVSNSTVSGGKSKIVFHYSDGSSDTFIVQNGIDGKDNEGGGGGDESSSIEVEEDPNEVRIFVDGELSATIPKKGDGPEITANKEGNVTRIYADGEEIAQILDGAVEQPKYESITCIKGINFEISEGKLKANVTKATFDVPADSIKTGTTDTVEVCDIDELDVVTEEKYSSSSHQFTNTRKRVKVIGTAQSAAGQTPFTATPLSGE